MTLLQDKPLPPLVANDYRKQVLAPIITRGGDPATSDPFELYALPLEAADRPDPVIIARLEEVWGFWQRHRDQPKYRTLVTQLVAEHDERSAALRVHEQRLRLAEQVRGQREQRVHTRFEPLDVAIRRLVERYRGIPEDKIEGLCELAAASHIARDEALRRLQRHRRVAAVGSEVGAPPSAAVTDPRRPAIPAPAVAGAPAITVDPAIGERVRQVRDLLDELGRHAAGPAPTTLFDLLGLEPDAAAAQIGERARMWRTRSREMPPGRLRAVLDELLVHVQQLLEVGPGVRAGYLDAVAAEVREVLRPRMRAAILVEDALLADDRRYLTDEAIALGLDHARAARVISELAAELTAPAPAAASKPVEVDPKPRESPSTPESAGQRRDHAASGPILPATTPTAPAARPVIPAPNPVEAALRAARAALRAGRCAEAKATLDRARLSSGPETTTAGAYDAASADIDEVIAAARLRWRAAVSAHEAGRHAEALGHLEHLHRTASDLPYPGDRRFDLHDLTARSRAAVAEADRLVAEAATLPESDRATRLLGAIERCAEHPEAMAQLAAIPVAPPRTVHTARTSAGVEVSWEPSPTSAVRYRVVRIDPDGAQRVVGRTAATSIVDGAVADSAAIAVYVVTAQQAGRTSEAARSDQASTDAAPPATHPAATNPLVTTPLGATRSPETTSPTGVPAPQRLVVRRESASVIIEWEPVPGATYKVTRLEPGGNERVVGRTASAMIEDGGAPGGPIPVYEVIALRDGAASASIRSER